MAHGVSHGFPMPKLLSDEVKRLISSRVEPSCVLDAWSQCHGNDPPCDQMGQLNSMLCICVDQNNFKLAEAVCQHRRFPVTPSCTGAETVPLWHALEHDNESMIQLLLDAGYDPSEPVKGCHCSCAALTHELSILEMALSANKLSYLDILLVRNKPVLNNRITFLGQTCLYMCDIATKTLDQMLARGVYSSGELDQCLSTGDVPLFATAQGNLKTFFVLLKHGADSRKVDPNRGTVLNALFSTLSRFVKPSLLGMMFSAPPVENWDEILQAIELMLDQGINPSIAAGACCKYPLCVYCELYGKHFSARKYKELLSRLAKGSTREARNLAYFYVMNEMCKIRVKVQQDQLINANVAIGNWQDVGLFGTNRGVDYWERSSEDTLTFLIHMAIIILHVGSTYYHMTSQGQPIPVDTTDELLAPTKAPQSELPSEPSSDDYARNIAQLVKLYPQAVQHGTMCESVLVTLMKLVGENPELYRPFLDIYLRFMKHEQRITAVHFMHDNRHRATQCGSAFPDPNRCQEAALTDVLDDIQHSLPSLLSLSRRTIDQILGPMVRLHRVRELLIPRGLQKYLLYG